MQNIAGFVRCAGVFLVVALAFGINPDTVTAQQRRVDTQSPAIPETASEPEGYVAERGQGRHRPRCDR